MKICVFFFPQKRRKSIGTNFLEMNKLPNFIFFALKKKTKFVKEKNIDTRLFPHKV
jgi:hypothetical protein